jgi:hypothetical protein
MRWSSRSLTIMICAAMAGAALVPSGTPASAAAAPAVTEAGAGIWGGGFVNSLTKLSGTGSKTEFMAAGDVWGTARTTNAGLGWTPQNDGMAVGSAASAASGLVSVDQKSVAAIMKAANGDLWAAFGTGSSTNTGLMVSAAGTGPWTGRNVTVAGQRLRFQANGPGSGGVNYPADEVWSGITYSWKHPRPTGGILLEDGTRLFAGTFAIAGRSDNQGLVMGSATTTAWTSMALGASSTQCPGGCTVTAILKDPKVANTYYVGTHGFGLFKVVIPTGCTATTCTAVSPITLTGATPAPDAYSDIPDLATGDGMIYVAAGHDGVFSATADDAAAGKAFAQVDPAHFPKSPGYDADPTKADLGATYVTAVDVAGTGSGRKVYAGVTNPLCSGAGTAKTCHSVMRINDSTASNVWTDIVYNLTPSSIVAGTSSTWWLPYANWINGGSYDVSSIKVVAGQVFVAGRSGVWRNPTATNDTVWEPAVQGLPGTIHNAVAAQNSTAAFTTVATDWRTFSGTGTAAVSWSTFPSSASTGPVGYSVAIDQSTSGAQAGQRLIGVGDDSKNNAGAIASSSNGSSYALISPAGTSRVLGLGVAYEGTTRHIYAAYAGFGGGTGFYQSTDGGTTWSPTGAPALLADTGADNLFADVEVPVISGDKVYVYDRATGNLWLGTNWGKSPSNWTVIYTVTGASKKSGWIATDPSSSARVWLSTSTTVTKLTTCLSGGCAVNSYPLPTGALPGPIAINPSSGTVYVTGVATYGDEGTNTKYSTAPAALYKFTSTNTWKDVSPSSYRQVGGYARGFAINAAGGAFVATNGQGVRYLNGLT